MLVGAYLPLGPHGHAGGTMTCWIAGARGRVREPCTGGRARTLVREGICVTHIPFATQGHARETQAERAMRRDAKVFSRPKVFCS
jgi:hypothetical protein